MTPRQAVEQETGDIERLGELAKSKVGDYEAWECGLSRSLVEYMKTKFKIVAGASVAMFLAIAVWLPDGHSSERVSVTFVGYTNDAFGIRTSTYLVPDTTNRALAVFRLANNDTRMFLYGGPLTEFRTRDGWVPDTNYLGGPRSTSAILEAGESKLVTVPNPPGLESWRCMVTLIRVVPTPTWRQYLNQILGRTEPNPRLEEFTVRGPVFER